MQWASEVLVVSFLKLKDGLTDTHFIWAGIYMCEILHNEVGEDLEVGKEGERREEEKKRWKETDQDGGKERKTKKHSCTWCLRI